MPSRTRASLLIVAAAAVVALLTWAAATHVHAGAWLDVAVLNGFTGLQGPRASRLAEHLAHLADPAPFALFGLALALIALARRGPARAGVVVGVLLGANVTTQILKALLASDRPIHPAASHISLNAWPSGHTTASASLALCLVLVAPAAWRPLAAAVGGAFTLGVVYSILLLGWHFPSDVVGGFCVATAWMAIGVGALASIERRGSEAVARVRSIPRVVAPSVGIGGLAAAAFAGIALARPSETYAYAQAHTTFFPGAALIGALALALAAAAAVSLGRR
jgi:membrane-associated phospholipid phosphatase